MIQKEKLYGNALLNALPRQDLAKLRPLLEEVEMRPREMLYDSTDRIEFAYFPLSGMISLVHPLADGNLAEVGLVGREGFFGVPLLHGAKRSPIQAMVQGEGTALRIRARDLAAEVKRSDAIRALLLRYAEVRHIQTSQTAACNSRHPVKKRLMRWLLEADDRMKPKVLALSHEFVAMMLGIRRAGVTAALGELRRQRIIETTARTLHLIDRAAAEAGSCECYAAAKAEMAQLLK